MTLRELFATKRRYSDVLISQLTELVNEPNAPSLDTEIDACPPDFSRRVRRLIKEHEKLLHDSREEEE